MASVNKVILIGNLGADPEVRYMPSGDAIANCRLATTDNWKDKNGEKQERTEWHRVSFFGKLAEIAGEYLKKGSQVYIEGRLQTRKWQDKDGKDQYTTEIVADRMQMLGGKSGGDSSRQGSGGGQHDRSGGNGGGQGRPAQGNGNRQGGGNGNTGGASSGGSDFSGGYEDDIPFGVCTFEADPIMRKLNRTNRGRV